MVPSPESDAKSISRGVSYIPFGIPGSDGNVRGDSDGEFGPVGRSLRRRRRRVHVHDSRDADAGQTRLRSGPRECRPAERGHPGSVTYITHSHDRDQVYIELDAVLYRYQFEA